VGDTGTEKGWAVSEGFSGGEWKKERASVLDRTTMFPKKGSGGGRVFLQRPELCSRGVEGAGYIIQNVEGIAGI